MNSALSDAAFWNRLHFGFTIVYHYLFPQLTMGLAWFLVYWNPPVAKLLKSLRFTSTVVDVFESLRGVVS